MFGFRWFHTIPSHITCSGYLDVAAANNIIMLFPQAVIRYSSPYSLLGCWDYVGYTGPLYGMQATKDPHLFSALPKIVLVFVYDI